MISFFIILIGLIKQNGAYFKLTLLLGVEKVHILLPSVDTSYIDIPDALCYKQ